MKHIYKTCQKLLSPKMCCWRHFGRKQCFPMNLRFFNFAILLHQLRISKKCLWRGRRSKFRFGLFHGFSMASSNFFKLSISCFEHLAFAKNAFSKRSYRFPKSRVCFSIAFSQITLWLQRGCQLCRTHDCSLFESLLKPSHRHPGGFACRVF